MGAPRVVLTRGVLEFLLEPVIRGPDFSSGA
jgi:hypothetical protein